jgi:hypothetical protein
MTAFAITGMDLTGVLRITWVHDNLAHMEDHSHTDETSGPGPAWPAPPAAWQSVPTSTTQRCGT